MATEQNDLHRAKTEEQGVDQDGSTALRTATTSEPNYPKGFQLAIIIASLYAVVFLIALDRTIIATAIPRITDDFNSIDDIGWYGSAYFLTNCAFILTFGRIYTFYSTKWTYVIGILIFEIGSAVCGAAPNSVALIIGRAIAGFGGSGIFTGAILIMVKSLPLSRRPLFQGMFGAVFGIASVIGPLMGGAFTDNITWRWCFYINLPIGAVVVTLLIFFLHLPDDRKASDTSMTFLQQMKQLDPLGLLCFLPAFVCLLLALQWGGVEYAWNSWRIILLFVLFGALAIGFITIQALTTHTTASVPGRIQLQRTLISGSFFAFCIGGVQLTSIYYLPIWFQAVKGTTAIQSGIDTLPLILGVVVASMMSGALVQRIGYYVPNMYFGVVTLSIGAGLIYTLTPDTSSAKWIGYQILLGFGVGAAFQQPNLAAQRVLHGRDIPTGTSLIFFWQILGGTVFIPVCQNIFLSKLISEVQRVAPNVNPALITAGGATAIRGNVDPADLPAVLEAYNYALVQGPFLVQVIVGCLAIFGAMGMEFLSLKDKPTSGPTKAHPNAPVTDTEKAVAVIENTINIEPMPVADKTAAIVEPRNDFKESVESVETRQSMSVDRHGKETHL